MENGGQVGMFSRLPFELCIQILSLLPIQSLLVLRSVCKWFISVIDDSDFVSFHLRHFPDNLNETEFLTVAPTQTPQGQTWKLQSSVDGLVLLVSSYRDLKGSHYSVLWNPSFRKQRYLPPITWGLKHMALGYDASSNDYKVLVMNGEQAWIYSVQRGAYCHVNTSSGLRRKYVPRVVCSQSLCFMDGVVWTETNESSNSNSSVLVWFDFATKRFRYANHMPCDGYSRTGLVMLDGGSTVGLWRVVDAEDHAASVWALQTDAMSWAPRYKIPQEMVPFGVGVEIVKVAERDGELVCKYWTREGPSVEVLSYHIQTKAMKRHGNVYGFDQDCICMGIMIESLIML